MTFCSGGCGQEIPVDVVERMRSLSRSRPEVEQFAVFCRDCMTRLSERGIAS
jgi:hypothetical protein